jgi:1-acyl-sn-glycerol-3-phosphate acyltransferase
LGVFRGGIGCLAVALGLPVVPVHLDGLAAALPKGRRWPRRGRARVTFGTPLRFADATPPRLATRIIEAAVRDLGSHAASLPSLNQAARVTPC